jgi:S-formylglutathione hydrolase FrmB
MGQSSGAWGSLWLLLNYPNEFGGAFAGSPDPVDFRDFIGTNIYEKNANVYFDSKGNIKYLVKGEENKYPPVTMKDFTGVDLLAGWGEQIYSFDAVFSKKDFKGEPLHLYDWYTGKVNSEVANSWKAHDLNLIVSNFDKHKIKLLQNKIHIYVADDDPFGLNRPVALFQKILERKGIKADILFFPDGGHNIWTDEIRKAMNEEMDKIVK